MRTIVIYAMAALFALLVSGCGENYDDRSPFDNAAYIDAAESTLSERIIFKRTVTELERTFAARLAYPASGDVEVSFRVDPSMIGGYNDRYGTDYPALPAAHYSLTAGKATVSAGTAVSSKLAIRFKDLDRLEIDKSYLVPLTVESVSGGVDILEGSRTIWYMVRRSSAITVAANLRDNYFSVPTFGQGASGDLSVAAGGPGDVVENMPSITYEALIWVDDFSYTGETGTKEISTVMGCEQHFLMRIGDASFPLAQLQMQGAPGKFPDADKSKQLAAKLWYHVALAWDISSQVITFYVNGEVQSQKQGYGSSSITSISLKNSVHGFFIGRSFNDDKRQLCGNIAEVRIWSVARTQQEIWDNMYSVDPQTEGLAAYWKFDTPGDVVEDVTGNGNDAVAFKTVVWPDGIEIPQLNRSE